MAKTILQSVWKAITSFSRRVKREVERKEEERVFDEIMQSANAETKHLYDCLKAAQAAVHERGELLTRLIPEARGKAWSPRQKSMLDRQWKRVDEALKKLALAEEEAKKDKRNQA